MDLLKQRESDPFYPPFRAFEDEYIQLRRTWLVFRVLFMQHENSSLLWRYSWQTSQEIGLSMVQHILLQLSRLTDNPGEANRKHLCLRQLRCELTTHLKAREGDSFDEKRHEFLEEVKSIVSKSSGIACKLRLHRNEVIVHLDWSRQLGEKDAPLPSLTFGEIGVLIMMIGDLIQKITNYLWETVHQHEWDTYDQAANLFNALKKCGKDS